MEVEIHEYALYLGIDHLATAPYLTNCVWLVDGCLTCVGMCSSVMCECMCLACTGACMRVYVYDVMWNIPFTVFFPVERWYWVIFDWYLSSTYSSLFDRLCVFDLGFYMCIYVMCLMWAGRGRGVHTQVPRYTHWSSHKHVTSMYVSWDDEPCLDR
jgi:hypothetical protein